MQYDQESECVETAKALPFYWLPKRPIFENSAIFPPDIRAIPKPGIILSTDKNIRENPCPSVVQIYRLFQQLKSIIADRKVLIWIRPAAVFMKTSFLSHLPEAVHRIFMRIFGADRLLSFKMER